MASEDRGQISAGAAEVYEQYFVPALFREWPPRLLDAARVAPGQSVLDVACGTGVLARAAIERVGPKGAVVGLDLNEGMLSVARRVEPRVDWRQGAAEKLPFPDGTFDAVVSQFGLMFFADRPRALREMQRVLKPGGRLAVAVWDAIERSSGYAAMNDLLLAELGPEVRGDAPRPFLPRRPRDAAPDPRRSRPRQRRDPHSPGHRPLSLDRVLAPHRRQRLDPGRPDRRPHLRPPPHRRRKTPRPLPPPRRHRRLPRPGARDRGGEGLGERRHDDEPVHEDSRERGPSERFRWK